MNKKEHTPLTAGILKRHGFADIGKCQFEGYENMNYWVHNGVCLFYNTPIQEGLECNFLVGYANMKMGKYYAVNFRGINNLEQLKPIYEALVGTPLHYQD